MTTCTHPPERLHAWWARDDTAPGGQVLCVACNACGAVLQGGFDSLPVPMGFFGRPVGEDPDREPRWPSPTVAQPSIEELEEFEEDGGCLATDGCWTDPDGTCPHGHPSWLLVLGMI